MLSIRPPRAKRLRRDPSPEFGTETSPRTAWRPGARTIAALAALILVAFAGSALKAQEFPEGMVGVWAEGDCDTASRVRILNAFGVMDFLTIGEQLHFQMLLFEEFTPKNGGTLVEGRLLSPTINETFDHTFDLHDGRLHGAFIRCPQAPPALSWTFGEMLAAFEAFGAIQAACARGDGPDCLQTAFRFADVNGDGQLTVAEIARVFRAVGFLVGYMSQSNAIVPARDLAMPVAVAGLVGPFLAKTVLESMDYDGNGALSLDELLQDRGDLAGLTAAAAAVEAAAVQSTLRVALEALPALFRLLPF